jgi:antitoxin MazE
MANLQISKWGNSLAVRIPADYIRKMGAKEGDQLQLHLGADGALNLRLQKWDRRCFAQKLRGNPTQMPMGNSVIEELRAQARY